MGDIVIEHRGHDFLALRDGVQVGNLSYRRRDAVVDAYTTYVQPDARKGGMALQLVVAFVAWVRAEGLTVRPTCWYVAKVMQADPSMHDLVA